MSENTAPEFVRFIDAERRAKRLPQAARRPMAEGDVFDPVVIDRRQSTALVRVAARRAAGFFRPTKRTEVIWAQGGNELAVGFAGVDAAFGDGTIRIAIPVRCDQCGEARVEVLFATGSPSRPAGLYASTAKRPSGPDIVTEVWSESLVAFAWQCVLGLVAGIAAAVGKDQRGNLLVPVELAASARGLQIVPMARHRFSGSSSLKTQAVRS